MSRPKKPTKKQIKKPQTKPLTSRERIFQATVDLICKGGPSAATARAICEKCNVTTPTLYHYYGDIYQLYDEVLALMFVPEASAYLGREYTDPRGMIDYMWDCCVETARTKPGLVQLKGQLISMGRIPEPMTRFYARLVKAFEMLAQHHTMTTPPKAAAAMFWAAAIGTANMVASSNHGGPVYPPAAAEALKQLIVNSVLTETFPQRKARRKSAIKRNGVTAASLGAAGQELRRRRAATSRA